MFPKNINLTIGKWEVEDSECWLDYSVFEMKLIRPKSGNIIYIEWYNVQRAELYDLIDEDRHIDENGDYKIFGGFYVHKYFGLHNQEKLFIDNPHSLFFFVIYLFYGD